MPLPYENATSGEKALGEIQKLLRGFGCSKFGSMSDDDAQEILVQFEYRGRPVSVKASIRGYAAAWLKEHPPTVFNTDLARDGGKAKRQAAERKAMDIASVAVYSILRDKALQLLDAVFDVVLADPAVEASGLIRTVRRQLTDAGKKLGSQAVDARAAAKRLERLKGLLLRKAGGEDIAALILDRKISERLRQASEADGTLAEVNAATAMLAEYGDEDVQAGVGSMHYAILQQMANAQFGGYFRR